MFLYALALIMVLVQALALTASKLIVENRKFYVLLPDSTKVFITPFHEGGGQNLVEFSPDSSHLIYTRTSGLGFESEGRAVYMCRPDGTGRTFIFRQEFHIGKLYWKQIYGKDILVFNNGSGGMDVGENFRVFDLVNRCLIFKTAGYIEQVQGLCFKIGSQEFGQSKKARNICLDTIIAPDMLSLQNGITYVKGNHVFNRNVETDSMLLTAGDMLAALPNLEKKPSSIEIAEASLSPDRNYLSMVVNIGQNFIGIYDRSHRQLIFKENPRFTTQRDFAWSPDSKKLGYVLEYGDGSDYKLDTNKLVILKLQFLERIEEAAWGNQSIMGLSWSEDSDTLYYNGYSDIYRRKQIFVGD